LPTKLNVDTEKVFVVGHSGGGLAAHALASAMPEGTFKGLASVSGTVLREEPMPPPGIHAIFILGCHVFDN
jgi:poly(3-hydroxybutyrate) depolymerase